VKTTCDKQRKKPHFFIASLQNWRLLSEYKVYTLPLNYTLSLSTGAMMMVFTEML
jgi:hypothetical protein